MLLEELCRTDGTHFDLDTSSGDARPVRTKLMRELRATLGVAAYFAASMPDVGCVGERCSSLEARKRPLPATHTVRKAMKLGGVAARADFGLLHRLAFSECGAGDIVVAADDRGTPHYIVTAAGAAVVAAVAARETTGTLSARRVRETQRSRREVVLTQIRQSMHMLLEGGATVACDTAEQLVDVRALLAEAGIATLALRHELAVWSASESKGTGAVKRAFAAWEVEANKAEAAAAAQ